MIPIQQTKIMFNTYFKFSIELKLRYNFLNYFIKTKHLKIIELQII